jgi:hypothetical protein
MTTLTQQLADYQAGFKQRAPAERVAMMEAPTAQLRASGIEAQALKVGAELPSLTLSDATGQPVDLRALNATGRLVIVFYRGGWCPYCNLELREWQRLLPQLRELGATLVAISPQTPDNSLSTTEKNELAFPDRCAGLRQRQRPVGGGLYHDRKVPAHEGHPEVLEQVGAGADQMDAAGARWPGLVNGAGFPPCRR